MRTRACVAVAVAVVALCHAVAAHADEVCLADPHSAWQRAVVQHGERQQRMSAVRGVAAPRAGPRVDVSAIAEALTLRERRGRKARLLVYASDPAGLCIWAFGGGGIAAYARLPLSLEVLSGLQQRFSDALGVDTRRAVRMPAAKGDKRAGIALKPDTGAGMMPKDFAGSLTEALLPLPILAALDDADQLAVVPIGSIGAVPFGLLQPWPQRGPLVERMSVSIAPGLAAALREPAGEGGGRTSVLVVGDPDFSADPDWDFPPLPGARHEAGVIAGMFGTQSLTGAQATVSEVLRRLAERPSLIYFATHAIADPDDPIDGGFLALANGRLTARTIQALSFGTRAPLVVLSACQTGLGRAHDAGIIGVARAFTIAGAANVLMSLWSVDDAATALLMERFMRLQQSLAPADALRHAMLALRREHDDPIYWAGFAVFGALAHSGPVDAGAVEQLLRQ